MGNDTQKSKKSSVIRIRCSAEELAEIQRKFKKSDLATISAYMRRSALQQKIIVKQSNADFELLQELKRSGNNLNQLTKLFHISKEEPLELRDVLNKYENVLDKVLEAL